MPFGLGGGRNTGINPRATMGSGQGGSGLADMLRQKMQAMGQGRAGIAVPPRGLGGGGGGLGNVPPPNGMLSGLPGIGASGPGPNQPVPGPRRMARRMGRGY